MIKKLLDLLLLHYIACASLTLGSYSAVVNALSSVHQNNSFLGSALWTSLYQIGQQNYLIVRMCHKEPSEITLHCLVNVDVVVGIQRQCA